MFRAITIDCTHKNGYFELWIFRGPGWKLGDIGQIKYTLFLVQEESNALFVRLVRTLFAKCGKNKHDINFDRWKQSSCDSLY